MDGLRFPVNTKDSKARFTTFFADVLESLDEIGHGKFKTETPRHTIKLIFERVRPRVLTSAMTEIINVE